MAKQTVIAEAGKLLTAFTRLEKREAEALAKHQEKFAQLRRELEAGASEAALRVLEVSRDELGGMSGK